ncbi:unnamed protein product, partial [Laminaria digitata]
MKHGSADMGYLDGWGDERNGSEIGASWPEVSFGGSPSLASALPNEMPATTPGGYLAVQRSRVEAEADSFRRQKQQQQQQQPQQQQQQPGLLPESAAVSGAAAAAATHHDPRLRLPHAPLIPGLPPHLLTHAYNNAQLQMTPHYPPNLVDPSGRGGMPSLWGHAGAGMLMGHTAHDELQQQQQQHLGMALQQVGPMGLTAQRLVGVGAPHLLGGGGAPAVGSGHLDTGGMHQHAISAQAARTQGMPAMPFPGLTGQNMVMSLPGGGHPQQAAAGAPGMMMFPPGGVGNAAGRMVPPNQGVGVGHTMGMVGSWQPPAGWSEQLMGPWQHVVMSQAQGPQPQQQQHHHQQ